MLVLAVICCIIAIIFAIFNYLRSILLSIIITNEGIEVDNDKLECAKKNLSDHIVKKILKT